MYSIQSLRISEEKLINKKNILFRGWKVGMFDILSILYEPNRNSVYLITHSVWDKIVYFFDS